MREESCKFHTFIRTTYVGMHVLCTQRERRTLNDLSWDMVRRVRGWREAKRAQATSPSCPSSVVCRRHVCIYNMYSTYLGHQDVPSSVVHTIRSPSQLHSHPMHAAGTQHSYHDQVATIKSLPQHCTEVHAIRSWICTPCTQAIQACQEP